MPVQKRGNIWWVRFQHNGKSIAFSAGKGATSFLHLRCKPSEKAAWVKAAQGKGGLSKWVLDTLNRAI